MKKKPLITFFFLKVKFEYRYYPNLNVIQIFNKIKKTGSKNELQFK